MENGTVAATTTTNLTPQGFIPQQNQYDPQPLNLLPCPPADLQPLPLHQMDDKAMTMVTSDPSKAIMTSDPMADTTNRHLPPGMEEPDGGAITLTDPCNLDLTRIYNSQQQQQQQPVYDVINMSSSSNVLEFSSGAYDPNSVREEDPELRQQQGFYDLQQQHYQQQQFLDEYQQQQQPFGGSNSSVESQGSSNEPRYISL